MTLSHYVDVVQRACPGVDLADVSVHSGQFHDVLITHDRVFRFPKTAAAAAELPARAAVLTAIDAADLGVGVPVPLSEVGPEGFLVLSRLHGTPLERADATSPDVVDVVAAEFARVLRALAAADVEKVGRVVPFADPGRWAEFAGRVRTTLFPLMSADGRARAERELAAAVGLDHVATGLVHGDLGGENVLWQQVEELPQLTGIVDWDEAKVGDPAEDLAAVGASYGTALLERVVALLGAEDAWPRIRAYQGTFALQQALAGAEDGDDEELDDGLTGYR
ncbi:capreomycin phosphotransferase [Saccharothrix variisporea]|uniref:Phosphotransferase family enzyme n=1 Tax=Saccharothrix variisporea TaxID=543527 RepID=A0A495XRP3_9PSEU|nr:capreomycin phosphotransferase [Saccharothrix variisporea]RKT74338.1 phosphotransferase family enzyme [Saccharothrix variisporea]